MTDIKNAGVTFYVDSSAIGAGAPDRNGKRYIGKVNLSATVRDRDLWEHVMEQLNGLLLYEGSDLKTELIGVLQTKAVELEQNLETQELALSEQVQRALQRASVAEADKVRAEQRVRVLEAEMEGLRELEQALEDM